MALEEDKPSLESLLDDFSHPNPNIYKKAYIDLIEYWPVVAMQKLLMNLSVKEMEVRRRSVQALGYFGNDAIFPVAKLFLSSENIVLRTSCLKVLVQIVSKERYSILPNELIEVINLSIIDDNVQITLAVISLLRQLEKKGLPQLIKLSRDRNILRAKASITALGEIDDPSAKNCLMELKEDTSLDILIRESVISSLEFFQNSHQN